MVLRRLVTRARGRLRRARARVRRYRIQRTIRRRATYNSQVFTET